jgi:hypothetical protein
MTNEEIRKLLGGYATNTLTDAERKILFEAALDNQELFNAMQEEQALKDLLSDPVSREQVRQALATPVPTKKAVAWWSQWWAWGSAASAVVAAILIVTVVRWNPVQPQRQEVAATPTMKPTEQQPASLTKGPPPASKPERAHAKTVRPSRPADSRNRAKDELAIAMAPPAPPTAPAQERESTPPRSAAPAEALRSQEPGHSQNGQVAQNSSANAQNTISNQSAARQEQAQVSPAVSGFRDAGQRGPAIGQFAYGLAGRMAPGPLRFSLMKRDLNGDFVSVPETNPNLKKGDAVQLRVVPVLPGYVSLSQLDKTGTWRRVFPSSGPGIPVVANSAYSVPAVPIEVTDQDEKFRVTLSLAIPETKADVSTEATREKTATSAKKARLAAAPKQAAEPSPLFVDITIGPKY